MTRLEDLTKGVLIRSDHAQFEQRDELEPEGVRSKHLPQPELTALAPNPAPA